MCVRVCVLAVVGDASDREASLGPVGRDVTCVRVCVLAVLGDAGDREATLGPVGGDASRLPGADPQSPAAHRPRATAAQETRADLHLTLHRHRSVLTRSGAIIASLIRG